MIARLVASTVILSVLLIHPRNARSAGVDTYDAPVSGADLLQTERAHAEQAHLQPFGRVSLAYDKDPLVLRNSDGSETGVLRHHWGTHLSLGVALWRRAHLALTLPAHFQKGSGLPGEGAPKRFQLGDVGLDVRYALLDRHDPVELALALRFTAPTAPKDTFIGDDAPTAAPGLLVSRQFGKRGVLIAAGLRTTLNKTAANTPDAVGNSLLLSAGGLLPVTDEWSVTCEGTVASEYDHLFEETSTPASLLGGLRYHPGSWVAHLGAGPGLSQGVGTPDYRLVATVGIDSDGAASPEDDDADGVPDARDQCPTQPEDVDGDRDEDGCPDHDQDRDGIDDASDACPTQAEDRDSFEDDDGCPDPDNDQDGVVDNLDRCPLAPEDVDSFEDEDGCPDQDNDSDGVADTSDSCPLVPEDLDGWQDGDGCPEEDNDGDGILDGQDQCPKEKETPNGVEDEDGCPDLLRVEAAQIRTLEPIYFENRSDKIQQRSTPLLAEMATLIQTRDDLGVIAIEGHTDSKGPDAFNLELSRRRAATVRTFLIENGVAPERLTASGYGETRPIASNDTKQGRDQNRRVEFRLTGMSNPTGAVLGEGQ